MTVDFNNLTPFNRALNGQYPSGVINWGTNVWFLSGPWLGFTTNSISFNSSGTTSQPITLITPRQLRQIEAFNGGPGSSTVSVSCAGQTTAQVTLAVNQRATLVTNWTGVCSTITIGSTNGWDTNFDNLILDDGP